MPREVVEPDVREVRGIGGDRTEMEDSHPAFAMIGASRVSTGPGGSVLFDSEIRHQHTVVITLRTAKRRRTLNRDWIAADARLPLVRVEMSEAQWASFVSSMNVGDGVACTLRGREGEPEVPGLPYSPRMAESMAEVRRAGEDALAKIREAFEEVEKKPTKRNIFHLRCMIENAPGSMTFAAKSLSEHAENVVQKARADIESMVLAKATQLGLTEGEAAALMPALLPERTGEEGTS